MTKDAVYIGSTPQNLTEEAQRERRREQLKATNQLLKRLKASKLQADSIGIKKV